MVTDIFAAIDHAIGDHETSADAMRWTPDPESAAYPADDANPGSARDCQCPPCIAAAFGEVAA